MKHESLISELSSNLEVTAPLAAPTVRAGLWLSFAYLVSLALILATGPLRPGFMQQLMENPRVLLELILGLAIAPMTIYTAFQLSVPDEKYLKAKHLWVAFIPLGLLMISLFVGLWAPSMESSMIGKRDHCLLETLIFGMVPTLVAYKMLVKAFPWRKYWSASLLAMAAIAPGAALMHIACMYDAKHILIYHMVPILAWTGLILLVSHMRFLKFFPKIN